MTHDLGPTTTQLTRMRATIFTDIATRHRSTKRRRLVGLGLAAVVAIGTSAAAIVVTQASNDEANTSFDCYSVADVRADHTTSSLVDDGRNAFKLLPLSKRVDAAIERCEASWSAAPDEPYPGSGPIDVPNPMVCVLADNRLGVFPNRAGQSTGPFCEGLGLSAPAVAASAD
ncbi:hypothetical protein C5D04_13720 [Rathayibacter sp. AY1D2]|jgi:hypothetical protein|uniref:hypothetical protein n=1 Tax=unclassified Rathayibacter TaxID=2609250 RepID=UPI000CE84CD4|nr:MULTISPECIES: hypothetical protein [unclassified Rathayibacter]PPF32069.1 hypothetical protein C5B93_16385 [Rathayibacter sp. AY1A2]PPI10868.1 hypothetical protein C5D04_13720 [Rathayibacter sp. AY1D2]